MITDLEKLKPVNEKAPWSTEEPCTFCADAYNNGDTEEDGWPATWMVGGYALCHAHAIEEVLAIMEGPDCFTHGWPQPTYPPDHDGYNGSWGEQDDAVPFRFEVRLIP